MDPPVTLIEILIDRAGHIHQGFPVLAQPAVLFAIDDVGTRGPEMVGGDQGLFHHVLDLLDGRRARTEAVDQNLDDLVGDATGLLVTELAGRRPCPPHRRPDFVRDERNAAAVPFDDLPRHGQNQALVSCFLHDPVSL